jgi:hypothetical protein
MFPIFRLILPVLGRFGFQKANEGPWGPQTNIVPNPWTQMFKSSSGHNGRKGRNALKQIINSISSRSD